MVTVSGWGPNLSCSVNSLEGVYIGVIKGDTRSLDNSSYRLYGVEFMVRG